MTVAMIPVFFKQMSDYYLKITSEGHTATFRLYDTDAAKELYDQLLLTLETTNFAGAQWMFYPPEHLSVTEKEVYHDGKKGELSYYDPWGDVFMLYEDFHSGDEMHRLGICLEGVDELEGMSGTIQVEKAERTETGERMDTVSIIDNVNNSCRNRWQRLEYLKRYLFVNGIGVKAVCDIISVINTQSSSCCRKILISTLTPITM